MSALYLDNMPIGLWLGMWALVYAGDYYLTILGARLFKSGAKKHFDLRGSYELTPEFQQDIDALRLVSPHFFRRLGLSCVVIYTLWVLEVNFLPVRGFVSLILGGLLLREAAVYLRHARVIYLFRAASRAPSLQGRISYPRWLTLKNSAVEIWGFSALYLLLALLFRSVFLAGGTLTCAITGWQHWRMGTKLLRKPDSGGGASSGVEPERPFSDLETS